MLPRFWVCQVPFCLLLLFPPGAGSFQTQAAAKGYAGSSVCRSCHPGAWLNFYKNPHYKSVAAGKPPEEAGCESCHGPGQAHVAARGGKNTIRAFSLMPPQAVLEACLGCHSQELSRHNIHRSPHTLAGTVCNNCHSIHRSPAPRFLLARQQTELCLSCHAPVRTQFSMPVKHRVLEGAMNCTDCHNPHGVAAPGWGMGVRAALVDHALANEQPCLKCHSDKRGPFTFEHPAVRVEGCGSCHAPHGSMNARLLRRPAVFTLCLECHNGAGGFGRQADGITLPSPAHNLADPRYRNCTTCHVRVHGSNADPLFLR